MTMCGKPSSAMWGSGRREISQFHCQGCSWESNSWHFKLKLWIHFLKIIQLVVSFPHGSTSILVLCYRYTMALTGPSAIYNVVSWRRHIPKSQLENNLLVEVCEYWIGSLAPDFTLPNMWAGGNLCLPRVRGSRYCLWRPQGDLGRYRMSSLTPGWSELVRKEQNLTKRVLFLLQ